MSLLTPADLAEDLRITETQILELRRRHNWPCVRFGHKTIRFTPEQAELIIAQHVTTPAPAPSRLVSVSGQTKRSQSRRRHTG